VNELHGNEGNDVLLGTFSDILDGGIGNDTLSGGWTMTGGGGADLSSSPTR